MTQTLARWPNVRRDEQGRVEAFGGLSLRPTEHRFVVEGRRLYTWSAWDTLFLPALLDEQALLESNCPLTDVRASLRTGARARVTARGGLGVVPPLARTCTVNIIESFCCHAHFLAGEEVAARWVNARDGFALDLDDAFQLGRLATRAMSATGGDS